MTLESFCIIVGVYELMIGIPLLVRPLATGRWLQRAMKEDVLIGLFCLLFLTVAVLVLIQDASIGFDSAGLVRLIAWLTAVECFLFCWWPGWAREIISWIDEEPLWLRSLGVISTGIGLWLLRVSGSISSAG